jgi:hypothetical protein
MEVNDQLHFSTIFPPGNAASCTRCVGPWAGLDSAENAFPFRKLNRVSSVRHVGSANPVLPASINILLLFFEFQLSLPCYLGT